MSILEFEHSCKEKLIRCQSEMQKIQPHLRSNQNLQNAELKMNESKKDFEVRRQDMRVLRDQFETVKEKRSSLFNSAYLQIAAKIDEIYKGWKIE